MYTHEFDWYERRRERNGEVVITIMNRRHQHEIFIFFSSAVLQINAKHTLKNRLTHIIHKLNPSMDANRLSKMMTSAFHY